MKTNLKKLLKYIQQEHKLIAPIKKDHGVFLSQTKDLNKIILSSQLTENSFKDFLFPQEQELFDFKGAELVKPKQYTAPGLALFGISIIDLRALSLYAQVFRHDPYFQARGNNTIVIGYLKVATPDQTFGIFKERLEEDTLEHLEFDVFVLDSNTGLHFFSGSPKGQKALTQAGIEDFENVEYVGPVKESGLDQTMVANYKKVKNSFKTHRKLWEELGKRCLACGKCSLVCPTCFCFSTHYKFGQKKKTGKKVLNWDTCFYSEFSRVAGGHKFLDTVAKRIFFWYEHKFVRIPDELSIPGCVGCGRCIKVCPVAIDISRVLAELGKPVSKLASRKTLKKKKS
ncbi:4Fe-4S dicluster domain-containing protein [Patescibacteria group bacterium]|nr:4Fe-4S dicluster domain-containing protein [Patescibacteria group bacterium]MBU1890406.1 4Fe-4S dicluster domain-containing protein [Patescibacteria group bacterium]